MLRSLHARYPRCGGAGARRLLCRTWTRSSPIMCAKPPRRSRSSRIDARGFRSVTSTTTFIQAAWRLATRSRRVNPEQRSVARLRKHRTNFGMNEAASYCVEHAYTPATADDTVELTFWTTARSDCVGDRRPWHVADPFRQAHQTRPRDRDHAATHPRGPVIHHDRRGTRVLLSHPLLGPVDLAADTRPGGPVTDQ